jgi:ABC-type polysaccharide/polyol phosphate export permease
MNDVDVREKLGQNEVLHAHSGMPLPWIVNSVSIAARAGLAEMIGGARHWRVWHLIGSQDLRHRYVRSVLGQFWVVLSTAMMIGTMGGVWSLLWDQPLRDVLPFIGIGLVIWTYISQVLLDCTSIFILHNNLYRNQRMNFSVSIYSVIYKNTILLAHSLVIVLAIIAIFGIGVNAYDLQIIPAFLLTWMTMLWAGYVVAMLCVRYRDIIQLINSWMFVAFLITPVLWKADFLSAEYHFLVDWNPFAQFLELLRNPLLGEPVRAFTWMSTGAITLFGALLSTLLIGRYQRRIIYWM